MKENNENHYNAGVLWTLFTGELHFIYTMFFMEDILQGFFFSSFSQISQIHYIVYVEWIESALYIMVWFLSGGYGVLSKGLCYDDVFFLSVFSCWFEYFDILTNPLKLTT